MNKYVRSDLKNFQPYVVEEVDCSIKLDANENPFAMHDCIKKEVEHFIKNNDITRLYPDTNSTVLRNEIASFYNVKKENVVVGVGSDQLIDCLLKGVVSLNDKVVFPNPSFSVYGLMIDLNHGTKVPVELDENFNYNVDDFIEASKDAVLTIICSPNNPTGNVMSNADIKHLANSVSGIVLIDEAYGEFHHESAIELIDDCENLVVFRTFSKAYGLAGLRIGYGIGSERALMPIEITRPPYNINSYSQTIATICLKNSHCMKEDVKALNEIKQEFYNKMASLSFKLYPSYANYILMEDNHNIALKLRKKGVLVRTLRIRGKAMIRLSIGTKEEMDVCYKLLKEINDENS